MVDAPKKLPRFRIRIKGKSMLKKYPHGSLVEFQEVEKQSELEIGRDYLVETTWGRMAFGRLMHFDWSPRGSGIALYHTNILKKEKFPWGFAFFAESIKRLAVAEYILRR